MKYTERYLGHDKPKIIIEFDSLDFLGIKLDDFDRALLDECNKSDKISDKLLALETLARRIEEA